ncbi:MAG: hypothetical protein IPM92_06750 [Saprospiraceae bacterium]|nr:hypothetical protein [Saprospiraceae bacterium]
MTDLLSFPDHARVWIYGADKIIDANHIAGLHDEIFNFTKSWSSHQLAVKATGGLLHGFFIVFVVDETGNKPGGCSIDGSVQFIRKLGERENVDFLNRQIVYYLDEDKVKCMPLSQLKAAFSNQDVTMDTLFFDTLVQDKINFLKAWLKPLKDSWQNKFL